MKKTESQKRENNEQVSFYETRDYLFEEIFDQFRVPEKQFIVYSRTSGKISYTDEINLESGKKLKPIWSEFLIDKNVVLLPSDAIEYSSEEKLIEEIKQFIHKYLDIHPFYESVVAHYVLMTWVFDRLSVVPYLMAIGDFGTGKTRFVQTVGALCYKPMFLAGATSDAYLFRVIELFGGTLVINELERVNTDLEAQIIVILNNGYEKGMAVGRVEGETKREPRTYNVFCPKIITTRKGFNDKALESRIITVPMHQTIRDDIPPFISDGFWQKTQEIRNKLLMYRFRHFSDFEFGEELLFGNKTKILNVLEPRLKQTLLPLFYVISDSKLEKQFINFAIEYQKQLIIDRGLETSGLVFEKLYELYKTSNGQVTVKEVTEAVNKEVENDKYKLTSHKTGKIIREELGFKTQKRTGGLYYVSFNEKQLEYLVSRYGVENPLNPQSPLSNSDLKVDLVDSMESKEEIIKEEKELRQRLILLDKNSKEYADKYHEWFVWREKGINLGLFSGVIPTEE